MFSGCEAGNSVLSGRAPAEVSNPWEPKACPVSVGATTTPESLLWEIAGVPKGVKGVETELKRITDVRMAGDSLQVLVVGQPDRALSPADGQIVITE